MEVKRHIPNTLTLLNLICGGLSILYIFQGEIAIVILLLGLSLAFDFLDGFIARLINASSPIGKQLDSLADVISFGMAPALIMMRLIQNTLGLVFPSDQFWGLWLIAILIPVCGAIRLARFNLDDRQEYKFYGLPTPANAILILSYWSILHFDSGSWLAIQLNNPITLAILTLISSFLMVSNIPLLSLKFKNFSFKDNLARYLLLLLGGLSIALLQYSSIPLIIILYILFSIWSNYMQGI